MFILAEPVEAPTQFYHVDRGRILRKDQILSTMPMGFGAATKSRVFADSMRDGLTRFGFRHGMGWAFDDQMRPVGMQAPPHMPVEQLYEAIRMGFHPNMISRFRAIFGCRTLEGARQFAAKYPGGSSQTEFAIWRVEATRFAELDLHLVNGHVSYPHTHDTALDYWSGHHSPTPLLEVLMEPPVRVVEFVEMVPNPNPAPAP